MARITAKQAAKELNCHIETMRRMCRNGRVDAVKAGKDWRVKKKAGEIVLSNGKHK